ncbi:MAG: hypothetical protein ACTSQY_09935 [Candidatus Odinarchaeia archaeon]
MNREINWNKEQEELTDELFKIYDAFTEAYKEDEDTRAQAVNKTLELLLRQNLVTRGRNRNKKRKTKNYTTI